MRALILLAAAAGLASACSPAADPAESVAPEIAPSAGDTVLRAVFAPYLGVWESEDGLVRQVFLEEDGGAAVRACLRRPDEAGDWRTISTGTYVRESEDDAAEPRLSGAFTGVPAMGFDRLEVTGYAVAGGGMDFTNIAVAGDTEEVTYETWSAPAGGRFDYVVERVTANGREPWFGGFWIFNGGVEPDCA
jgi:hypothetical protein